MTEAQAQQLVTVLVTAYPSFMAKLTDAQQRATQAVYRRFLLDLDYELANAAIERAVATGRYWPSIAELRESALTTAEGEKRAGGEAWGDVQRAIARWGGYRTPSVDFHFEDPLTARCVSHMGWSDLCRSENAIADRARFIQLYDELARGGRTDRIVRTLPGQGGGAPPALGGVTGINVNVQRLLNRITEGS